MESFYVLVVTGPSGYCPARGGKGKPLCQFIPMQHFFEGKYIKSGFLLIIHAKINNACYV